MKLFISALTLTALMQLSAADQLRIKRSLRKADDKSTATRTDDESNASSRSAQVSNYLSCLNTGQRQRNGWVFKGMVSTEAEARARCAGYKYMSLECPRGGEFETFCVNEYDADSVIADEDCKGNPTELSLNNGKNGHCVGPYTADTGIHTGGYNRGALYELNPVPTTTPIPDTEDTLKDLVNAYCEDPINWEKKTGYTNYGKIEDWDTSKITSMQFLFYSQESCNPDISGWDVSKVTDFWAMFEGASSFNQNISGWDVSSGIYFGLMFDRASSFNQNISGWDVSKGTYFGFMFKHAKAFDQDLCIGTGWNKVKDIDPNSKTSFCVGGAECGDCF